MLEATLRDAPPSAHLRASSPCWGDAPQGEVPCFLCLTAEVHSSGDFLLSACFNREPLAPSPQCALISCGRGAAAISLSFSPRLAARRLQYSARRPLEVISAGR